MGSTPGWLPARPLRAPPIRARTERLLAARTGSEAQARARSQPTIHAWLPFQRSTSLASAATKTDQLKPLRRYISSRLPVLPTTLMDVSFSKLFQTALAAQVLRTLERCHLPC